MEKKFPHVYYHSPWHFEWGRSVKQDYKYSTQSLFAEHICFNSCFFLGTRCHFKLENNFRCNICNAIYASFCYKRRRLLIFTFRSHFCCVDKRRCHWFSFALGTPLLTSISFLSAAMQPAVHPRLHDTIKRSPCRKSSRTRQATALESTSTGWSSLQHHCHVLQCLCFRVLICALQRAQLISFCSSRKIKQNKVLLDPDTVRATMHELGKTYISELKSF
jgi:hypothetical protein